MLLSKEYLYLNYIYMKTILKTLAIIAMAATAMTACSNARAHNEKKTVTKEKVSAVIELTSDEFNSKVYDTQAEGTEYLGKLPAVIDFTASWCGPCRSIAPILEEIAEEYKGQIVVYKIDVDKYRDIAQAFGITSIPAILYIPMANDPSMTIGARSKDKFKTEIDKILLGK